MTRRPLIVIPGRLSLAASALRHSAVVTARTLIEAVQRAGGEPVTVGPFDPAYHSVGDRLRFADGVLLPGGGDLAPSTYGQTQVSKEVYDVDALQDAFDLDVADWAFDAGLPLLAICRGMQVLNVARGGSLEQHMQHPHRHVRQRLTLAPDAPLAEITGSARIDISCYHHQCIATLGRGLQVGAVSEDGTIEALSVGGRAGFAAAVQWHPEDTAKHDRVNQSLFDALVDAAR